MEKIEVADVFRQFAPADIEAFGARMPPSHRRAIEDISLPRGTAIVAIVRDEKVIIAHHDTVVETDDHVILFMTDRRSIEKLESLFQVDVSFV